MILLGYDKEYLVATSIYSLAFFYYLAVNLATQNKECFLASFISMCDNETKFNSKEGNWKY